MTPGGAVGGLAGFGLGLLLREGGKRGGGGSEKGWGEFEPFIAKLNVSISESSGGRPQQQTELTARAKVAKLSQEPETRETVVAKLAAQIAAMMP